MCFITGRIVDWQINGLKTAEGASGVGLSLGSLDQDDEVDEDMEDEAELEVIQEEDEDEVSNFFILKFSKNFDLFSIIKLSLIMHVMSSQTHL